jgi:hypothetical protein
VDEERAAVVVQAYTLAAAGSTDWEVATQTGVAKTHVGELPKNPIQAGTLRTGEAAGIAPHQRMFYELAPDAIELGLNAALPAEFEFTEREFGRGERI